MILHIGTMFICDRGTTLVFILLLLAHLASTERQKKLKELRSHKNLPKGNRSSVSANRSDRLKKVHDEEIEKLIVGSSKSIRWKSSSSDNRADGLSGSKENYRWRETSRGLDTSIAKTIGKGSDVKSKHETKKKPKLLNMRKSQQRNGNLRKNKISPIRGCSAGGKGNKKGHDCRNPGGRVKRQLIIPRFKVIDESNTTCVIPISNWFWPGFWTIFG